MQPDDLRGAARDAYHMWRNNFGLSEQSAMRGLEQDGAISLSEDEELARRFQNICLSESEARRAVDDHGGRSVPPGVRVCGAVIGGAAAGRCSASRPQNRGTRGQPVPSRRLGREGPAGGGVRSISGRA
jgi:hypothetical protein